ncbi:hypothetical protein FACS1894171_2020 [Clostridia bacterium]|nr:hypothetical protein FACS1894171_2020 [Clostridia bacterium]
MNGKERAALRARANGLKTILYIGKGGVSENLILQLDGAFEARELVKARVLPGCELSAREACDQLAAVTKSESIQVIGTRFVLYRESEKLRAAEKAAKDRLKKAEKLKRQRSAVKKTRVPRSSGSGAGADSGSSSEKTGAPRGGRSAYGKSAYGKRRTPSRGGAPRSGARKDTPQGRV